MHLLQVWDLRQRDCIRTIKGHGRAVRQLALSPDSQMLATGCEGGEIKVISPRWALGKGG